MWEFWSRRLKKFCQRNIRSFCPRYPLWNETPGRRWIWLGEKTYVGVFKFLSLMKRNTWPQVNLTGRKDLCGNIRSFCPRYPLWNETPGRWWIWLGEKTYVGVLKSAIKKFLPTKYSKFLSPLSLMKRNTWPLVNLTGIKYLDKYFISQSSYPAQLPAARSLIS